MGRSDTKILLSFVLIITLGLVLNSCSFILAKKYGVKKIRKESFAEQKQFLIKNNLDTSNLFMFNPIYLDSLKSFSHYLAYTDSSAGLSPVQFRMYNSKGDLVAGWEQCFGDPEGTRLYEQFPPRKFDWINDKLNFYRDSNLVLDHEGKEINPFYFLNNSDYVIIAFWAEYMGKFSKNMLKDLENYIEKHNDKKIALLKVNFGNPWGKSKN